MDFIPIEKAAARWNVSSRVAQRYCAEGKVPGARKYGRAWMVPEDAAKPSDNRKKRSAPRAAPLHRRLFLLQDLRLDGRSADEIASSLPDDEYRREFFMELEMLQGRTESALKRIAQMPQWSPFRLTSLHCRNIVAIRQGDYGVLCRGMEELDALRTECGHCPDVLSGIDLAEATVYASIYAAGHCPLWLQKGDMKRFPLDDRPYACYLYSLYLNSTSQPRRMLGVAETALSFASGPGFTVTEIYLLIMWANACVEIDRREQAKEIIGRALEYAVPYGILSPFSEQLTTLRGVVESVARERFPGVLRQITKGWKDVFGGWTEIRNSIVRSSATKLLTAKEYEIALCLIDGLSYKEIADRMGMTVAATNYALQIIREKLSVKKSRDVVTFVNWSLKAHHETP